MLGSKCIRLLVIFLASSAAIFGQAPSPVLGVRDPLPGSPPRWSQPISPVFPNPPVIHRTPIASPPGPVRFRNIARTAGMIFSGTVTNVEHRPAHHDSTRYAREFDPETGPEVDTVAITFHVENAIRGTISGTTLTIRQWMGAWSAGQRYRVGERLLLFLYPPSRLGLTSWAGGRMGRFDVDAFGRVTLTPEHLSAFRTDPFFAGNMFGNRLGGKPQLTIGDFTRAVHLTESEP